MCLDDYESDNHQSADVDAGKTSQQAQIGETLLP